MARAALVGALLAGVSGHAAYGQEADNGLALEDIVVTAQKREESLRDVPISVSVVTGDAMREAGVSTLERVAASSPTLRVSNSNVGYIGIRGLGSGENTGFEQSVATFVDGVYRPRVGAQRNGLFDIARIEILNGPQTTFFGANAIAGAINITTQKPTSDFSGYASGLFDPTSDEYNLEGAVGGPLIGDTLLGRLSLRASGMNGYVYNSKTGRHEPRNRDAQGRLSLQFKPSDTVSIEGRVDYIRRRNQGAGSYELTNCPPAVGSPAGLCLAAVNLFGSGLDNDLDWKTTHGTTRNNQDYWEAAITTTIDIGSNTLTSVTAAAFEDHDPLVDAAAVPQRSIVNTQHVLPLANPEKYQQYSQELRFATSTEEPFSFMVGGYYEHNRLRLKNHIGFFFVPIGSLIPALPGISASTPIGGSARLRQNSDHYSVFASAEYRITDQLKLSIGARYSSVHKSAHRSAQMGVWDDNLTTFQPLPALQNQVAANIVAVALADFTQTSRTDSEFMPSANIQYRVNDDLMLYGKYSKGFKAGGFDGVVTANIYGPEKVDAFEVGLKSSFLDRRGTIDIALFTSNYKGLQESAVFQPCPTCAPSGIVTNAAKVRSRGAEISSQFRATQWLQLSAGGSYLEAIYKDYPNAPCTPLQTAQIGSACRQDLAGRPRPFAPKLRFNIGADITAPIMDDIELRLGGRLFYSSSFFFSNTLDPLLWQDSYTKLDLRAAVGPADGKWEAALIVRNVTDNVTAGWGQILATSLTTAQVIADPPRTVGLQVTVKW